MAFTSISQVWRRFFQLHRFQVDAVSRLRPVVPLKPGHAALPLSARFESNRFVQDSYNRPLLAADAGHRDVFPKVGNLVICKVLCSAW